MSLKQHIIDETTKMFTIYGVKAIRMDDIATNLGISKRTIYEIFVDKETLIEECLIHYNETLHRKKEQKLTNASNVIEEFLFLLDDWEANIETNYKLMVNVKKFYPKVYKKVIVEYLNEGYAELKEKIKQGIADGLILDSINYDLAVAIFSYSVLGILSKQNMTLPNNISETDAFKYVITYFFRGIATAKGIAMIDKYIEKEWIDQKSKNADTAN